MLTTAQAAALLNVKRTTVLRYIRLGKLPAVKHGRDWQVAPEAVAAFGKPSNGRPKHVT